MSGFAPKQERPSARTSAAVPALTAKGSSGNLDAASLQRTFGNQALQRMLRASTATAQAPVLVAQRAGTSAAGVVQRNGLGTGGPVRAATPQEKREFARSAATYLRQQGEYLAPQTTRNLADVLTLLRTTVESALATLTGDTAAAPIVATLQQTYFEAVRAVLNARTQPQAGNATAPPTLQEMYEQNRAGILTFGQPFDTGAAELSAELETPLPAHATAQQRTRFNAIQAARQRLRVATAGVTMGIEDYFSTAVATTTIPLPAHTTARFSSTIPAGLQRGLRSVAATLAGGSLAANTTVMLALDLSPFGGSFDAYRFTRLDLGATLGTEILIERQGAIGPEGLRAEERTRLQQRFDRLGFVRNGFSDADWDQVLIAVGEMPEAQLAGLGALRFRRQAQHPTDADAAAQYDQTSHTVTVFNRAYNASMARAGRPGHILSFAAYSVVHEVGHAHDLSALRTTSAATERAQAALIAEFGTGGTGYRIPGPGSPERARFNQLNTPLTAATHAEQSARSLSGARWTTGDPATVTDELAAGAHQPAFRQAALADGGPAGRQMPTTYPNPQSVWEEYFAESFAMYQTSPDLLRRLRPHVFHFMEQTFPR